MKIWVKNFFYTIMIIMITMTLSLTFLYFFMPIYYLQKQENIVNKSLTVLTEKYQGQPIGDSIDDLKKQETFNGELFNSYRLLDDKNSIVFQSTEYTTAVIMDGVSLDSSGEKNNVEIYTSNITELKKKFVDNKGNQYTLVSQVIKAEIENASDVLLELSPLVLVVSLVLGTIAALFYSKQSTKRIRNLSEATNYMLTVDSSYQCEVTGNDEIAHLAKDVNHLNQTLVNTITALEKEIKKVEESEQYKAYFFQSAAHELKTPMTIMTGIVEGMRLNVGRYKNREKYLELCQELLKKQSNLIQELSSVTRIDAIESENTPEFFSLDQLIREQVSLYDTLSETNDQYFDMNLEPFFMEEDKYSIELIISNIISNAYIYRKKGSPICISLTGGVLQIENECKPLSNEVLKNIFKPFYRPDYARNQKDGGTGLGLFIVKTILEKRNYDYSFYSKKDSMIFEINFKQKNS